MYAWNKDASFGSLWLATLVLTQDIRFKRFFFCGRLIYRLRIRSIVTSPFLLSNVMASSHRFFFHPSLFVIDQGACLDGFNQSMLRLEKWNLSLICSRYFQINKNYLTVDLNDEIQVTELFDINSELASLLTQYCQPDQKIIN